MILSLCSWSYFSSGEARCTALQLNHSFSTATLRALAQEQKRFFAFLKAIMTFLIGSWYSVCSLASTSEVFDACSCCLLTNVVASWRRAWICCGGNCTKHHGLRPRAVSVATTLTGGWSGWSTVSIESAEFAKITVGHGWIVIGLSVLLLSAHPGSSLVFGMKQVWVSSLWSAVYARELLLNPALIGLASSWSLSVWRW